MKEFYRNYFYIPKHGKIKDNVMLIRTIVTAVTMILCLAVMSFTAYAYFSYNVTSASNRIQAAHFSAKVTVNVTEGENNIPVIPQKEKPAYTAELEAGKTYFVTLSYGDSTASTGFCVITAKNCLVTYHTQQLWKTPGEGKTQSVTFSLTVSKTTTVEILSCWGTSCYYDAYCNGTLGSAPYILDGKSVSITVSDYVIHTVVPKETLSGIAEKYNVPLDQILAYNSDITDPDKIEVGQELKIPFEENVESQNTTDTPDETDVTTPSTAS